MGTLVTLIDIACGRPIPAEDSGRSRRLQLVVFALLASPIFPERTAFSGGIDHIAQSAHPAGE